MQQLLLYSVCKLFQFFGVVSHHFCIEATTTVKDGELMVALQGNYCRNSLNFVLYVELVRFIAVD